MSNPLGLSIGTTNLVAAGAGHQPVIRRSVLTLYSHFAPEVGIPQDESASSGGVVVSGFVDRVGDPVPMTTADGATYPAEQLVVEALESMSGLALSPSSPTSGVALAVPSYWSSAMFGALQNALGASETLSPKGIVSQLIPDSVAAIAALNASPGLDPRGTVVLLDFGGGGTSITLADAASAFEVIDGTDRVPEFAGDQLDQTLLSHVLTELAGDGDVGADQTAAVGSLALLREQCRSAKERLSQDAVTDLDIDLPGHRANIRLTRAELEELIERPLDRVFVSLEEMLGRNNIGWDAVSTVALVGGGASIPLIAQRLSERSQARVVTSQQPALDASVGAALLAAHGREAETATWVSPEPSAPALAWSQDEEPEDVVPYGGGEHRVPVDEYEIAADSPNPSEEFEPEPSASGDGKPWQRLPASVFGVAAAIAMVTVGGVAIALTSIESADQEQPKPGTAPLSSAFPQSGVPGETATVHNQSGQTPDEPTPGVAPPSVDEATTLPATSLPTTTMPTTTVPTTTSTTNVTTTSPTTTTTTATTTTTTTTTTTSTTATTTAPTTTTAATTTAVPTTTTAATHTTVASTTASPTPATTSLAKVDPTAPPLTTTLPAAAAVPTAVLGSQ